MKSTSLYEAPFDMRHIGPSVREEQEMLATLGVASLDELIDQTVPSHIRLTAPLDLPDGMGEHSYLAMLKAKAEKNQLFRSYIGLGYYNCHTPSVIRRNILENPGWYTSYTPYQAEISQGRLEAILNYQTMVADLTGMEIANASLLDEGTAAAEAMIMARGIVSRSAARKGSLKFFVCNGVLPQTADVLATRAEPLGYELVRGDFASIALDESFFGVLLQYPALDGKVHDYRAFVEKAHALGLVVVVAADLMALVSLLPPGEFGADIVVGNSQRFGVPMGFGGPHAAYFATKQAYVRQMPGRIMGVSVDRLGNRAYRMTLQTREQHIRREKATSNICTAQALLAVMAGMYAIYHGPTGLRNIAASIHTATRALDRALRSLGYEQLNAVYFDTLLVKADSAALRPLAEAARINFRYVDAEHVGIALDETVTVNDLVDIVNVFAAASGKQWSGAATVLDNLTDVLPTDFVRRSDFLTHPVFNMNHSETEMMRYIKRLENKDVSLVHSMIPLGSCTMKLNAATQLYPITWPEFGGLHPFVPAEQVQGYREMIDELSHQLCVVTGFSAASLMPNSGAQGEYTGLMVIRAYHVDHGQPQRNVVLIPSSAHGTNPASAVMAGAQVVIVNCDELGNIDVEDLRAKAAQYSATLAALMVTYPSTHGVFEESITEICRIVHDNGGLVYMDGANLNAQLGLTSPAMIGADVCHLNLHKTFAIPHGGGGPGMGPICVNDTLAPYLPGHPLAHTGGDRAIPAVSAAPWGSASILPISYGYITMLGAKGLTDSTKFAILNANYLKARLEKDYSILYTNAKGRVAHEFILDLRPFKDAHIEAEDVAKRLMDYGFHAPTVAFPVAGTLMIEPTESESKAELDRFADALLEIRKEIQDILDGTADAEDNVLKNAPHTAGEATNEVWEHPYTRAKAVFPLPYVRQAKVWTPVARIDNSYGDRNIMCSCPPIEEYMENAG
ncbi:MAG TPA: aminomethyl-transferring glycine dehydrogenase [Bacteroidota bacterium]|nr:aminomethyl-transferring glycine dehydrogenase [Bacteroidota bacterium]